MPEQKEKEQNFVVDKKVYKKRKTKEEVTEIVV